jgi:hypothetical protein
VAHGVPTGAELAQAAREFLEREVMPAMDGRLRFLTRVAANVVGQLEREFTLGPQLERAHREGLAAFGVSDDRALCRAIRDGSLDKRIDEVIASITASVVDKLMISNPRYLHPQHRKQENPQFNT